MSDKKFELSGDIVKVRALERGFCPSFPSFTDKNGAPIMQVRRPADVFLIDKAYLSNRWMQVVEEQKPQRGPGRPPKSSKPDDE